MDSRILILIDPGERGSDGLCWHGTGGRAGADVRVLPSDGVEQPLSRVSLHRPQAPSNGGLSDKPIPTTIILALSLWYFWRTNHQHAATTNNRSLFYLNLYTLYLIVMISKIYKPRYVSR